MKDRFSHKLSYSLLQRYLICLALCMHSFLPAQAQSIHQAGWQQEVNYHIKAKLFPAERMLRAKLEMEYINHSPDTLHQLYIHQWPNAYRSTKTAFAKQILENGKTEFEFAPQTQRGYLDSTHWEIKGAQLSSAEERQEGEIVVLTLANPLLPGEKLLLSTSFRLRVPDVFSRMGYGKGTWQMTQWFPKAAVYDTNGWHAMPYLDQGEFYADFGHYRVELALPENMLVAATGKLLSAEEMFFRQDRMQHPLQEPGVLIPPSKKYKIVIFEQENVHDFAWFASCNYNLVRDVTYDADGDSIETWVFGCDAPGKINFTKSIASALQYYSGQVGKYPYAHCTVVKGALKAGGGMEYPMITVCDVMNDEVIVHEVGHNWFQGMLGTNERRYPWMDESINSFVENQCLKEMREGGSGEGITALATKLMAADKDVLFEGQAIGDPSEAFSWSHYGTYIYGKGAWLFEILQDYLGEEVFLLCMQHYFGQWQFKHPLPGDMQKAFESQSGKDLSWFFNDWIAAYEPEDYAIKNLDVNQTDDGSANLQLKIGNRTNSVAPFTLSIYDGKKLLLRQWFESSGEKEQNIGLLSSLPNKNLRIELNDQHKWLDYRLSNNQIKTKGLLKKVEPLKLSPLVFFKRNERTQVYWLPMYAWNATNQNMAGLLLHNRGIPQQRWQYRFMPLYSFNTQNLNGYGKLSWHQVFRRSGIKRAEIHLNASSFAFRHFNDRQQFQMLHPQIILRYRGAGIRSSLAQHTAFNYRSTQFAKISNTSDAFTKIRDRSEVFNLEHIWKNSRLQNPWDARINMEFGKVKSDDFAKLSGHLRYTFSYKAKSKGLQTRLFAGWMPVHIADGLYHFRAGMNNGTYDYLFEHATPGRGMRDGLWGRQVLYMEDFAKFRGNPGNADQWLWSINLRSTLPGKIPFQLYADATSWNNMQNFYKEPFFFNGGFLISIWDERMEVYFPLMRSAGIERIQSINGIKTFGERITFRLDLNRLNPFELYKELKLF